MTEKKTPPYLAKKSFRFGRYEVLLEDTDILVIPQRLVLQVLAVIGVSAGAAASITAAIGGLF